MNKIASEIFDKLYQSYTMGGDVYCFKYNTKIFGIPMVELIKEGYDSPLKEQGCFKGPYPAGDPGIFFKCMCITGAKDCIYRNRRKRRFWSCICQSDGKTSCLHKIHRTDT